jgi:hypothetical protein
MQLTALKTIWRFSASSTTTSTTRQSKNFTPVEVKKFRTELYTAIEMAFRAEVRFGEAQAVLDPISGHYIRAGDFESADLKIQLMADGRYHVSGLALWGKGRKFGPHLGELDFIAEMSGDTIEYSSAHPMEDGRRYRAVLRFSNGHLTVTEENSAGNFGMNVYFHGEYEKAT